MPVDVPTRQYCSDQFREAIGINILQGVGLDVIVFLEPELQIRCSMNSKRIVSGRLAGFKVGVQSPLNSSPSLKTRPSGYLTDHAYRLLSSGKNVNLPLIELAVWRFGLAASGECLPLFVGSTERALEA
jgi:hypothetical protein